MRIATFLQVLVALFVFALASVACTADDGDLDGKKCDIGLPRDQQCIAGYSCACDGGDTTKCYCRKTSALTAGALQQQQQREAQMATQPAAAQQLSGRGTVVRGEIDPSIRLLRQLYGLELD
ncbi:MAG: hypothetical protein KC503_10650 [Myxococcales bacterium]|nr:hypothetical protein [Myxococcales bacterium]